MTCNPSEKSEEDCKVDIAEYGQGVRVDFLLYVCCAVVELRGWSRSHALRN